MKPSAQFRVGALLAAAFAAAVLSGCASLPAAPAAPNQQLFHDALFQPPSKPVETASIFALSPAMRDYLQHDLGAGGNGSRDVRRQLFDALYRRDKLQLEYDAAVTRNAADTFAARAGNCLSLAIMTAALARELNLPVEFRQIDVDQAWSRSGNVYFASNHVNLALGRPRQERSPYAYGMDVAETLTVDFIPVPAKARDNAKPLDDATVIAMFLNNRAAELLAAGQLDEAYWAARKAAETAPQFLNVYNTLGVIYQHHGDHDAAEQVLRYAHAQLPDNTIFLSNLVMTLENANKPEEAALLRARLALLEPTPPFYYFQLGREAMQRGDYASARKMFEKELERVPDYHEFHFWLAVANYQLGNLRAADNHMKLAMDNSTTRTDHDLYSAKLDRLRAYEAQLRAK